MDDKKYEIHLHCLVHQNMCLQKPKIYVEDWNRASIVGHFFFIV